MKVATIFQHLNTKKLTPPTIFATDLGRIFNKFKSKTLNSLLSASGRFEAHFSQILIKNIKLSLIGLRPIWGSFFNKLKLKYKTP
jgi:hypothetical protein